MKKRMRYRCMHSQSMNRLNRWSRLSPVMSCRWIGRHFCRREKALIPTFPAQVRAEQRGRPRWEQRQGQEVELKGSLACLWLFFKEASLVDQGESATVQIWNGILHFSLSFLWGVFRSEGFQQRWIWSYDVECRQHNSCFFFFYVATKNVQP